MKSILIYIEEEKIVLLEEGVSEVVFDLEEYKDILENVSTDKYKYFKLLHSKYNIYDAEHIKEKFLPIFNFILMNNISNYIMDKIVEQEYEINFEDIDNFIKEVTVKLTGVLQIGDVFNNIYNILKNYNSESMKHIKKEATVFHCRPSLRDLNIFSSTQEDLNSNFSVNKKEIGELAKNDKIKYKKIEELFYYSSKEKEKLKQKLEEDLIAFNYVTENKKNKFKRYILPIYVDIESLKNKGIENINNYLENWKSIAYLKMLTKIHDYFLEYYKLEYSRGLNVDILTVALLEIFDSEIKPYPKGLKKSVEIGRATAGKCYFIDEVIRPIPLSVDIALILQGKDIFSVVVEVSKKK